MNQKLHYFVFMLLCSLSLGTKAQSNDTIRHEVLLETSMGNIRLVLYNETPLHRDNFLRLVKDGYYDGNLFHRVISNFMIQSGDSTSRHAKPGSSVGEYSPDYTISAEIVYPKYFHKRGALAAAREGDDVNPRKRSSATQFYFVWGRKFSQRAIEFIENRMTVALTPEMKEAYMTYGGTPHLDGAYTVFGEITEGLEVVERIQNMATDEGDHPLQPIMILRTTIVREQ